MTIEDDYASRPMTRADVEDLGLLRCVDAGHATTAALCAFLGLSPVHGAALEKVLSGMVQRGLLDNDGNSFVLTEAGLTRLTNIDI